MVIQFRNLSLQKIFEGQPVKGKPKYSNDVITKFKKVILMLQYADSIAEIKKFKGLNFEALKGRLKGLHSVRVDYKYRLILSVEKDETLFLDEMLIVEDLTNHYQ